MNGSAVIPAANAGVIRRATSRPPGSVPGFRKAAPAYSVAASWTAEPRTTVHWLGALAVSCRLGAAAAVQASTGRATVT
jgi:hypothetical protein